MQRREFLSTAAAVTLASGIPWRQVGAQDSPATAVCPTYATPAEAMKSPRETLAYLPAIYVGTPVERPDYLATVDVDPQSANYGRVIHRLEMPNVGDELHHFGWNACSSCHGDPSKQRRYLVLPGLRSSRIHIVDVADPRSPKLHKVIEPAAVQGVDLSAPHTVHCLPNGQIMLSMLGNAQGEGPGGFLLLDENFEIAGRWEKAAAGMKFNYDFWYQPRRGVMVSSEWAAPNTVNPGFKLEDVQAGKYGQRLHFWDWKERSIKQSIDLGTEGLIPLEVRFQHDPESTHGFVGAALASSIWHWHEQDGQWKADKVVQVEPVEPPGLALPRAGTDHRPRALARRPLALSLELATRRSPPIRRERPRAAPADRPGVARGRARQG